MSDRDFGYRREFKRLPCTLKGSHTASTGVSYAIQCKDISAKGAGLITDAPLQIDSQVKIDLTTRKKLPLLLAGRVCWCKKVHDDNWHAGVMFNRQLPFELARII
jgi:hypothetical protein